MVVVKVFYEDGRAVGFVSEGHADTYSLPQYDGMIGGYDGDSALDAMAGSGDEEDLAQQLEEKICCAAVSALTQTAVLGLMEHLGVEPDYHLEDGYMDCSLPEGLNEAQRNTAHLLLNTMEVGIRSIQGIYPLNVKILTRQQGDEA